MRYYTRLKVWKNKSLRYDPEKLMAFSYDWFCFLRQIEGVLIFNITPISPATTKHQHWVKDKLDSEGIGYLMVSYFKGSLSGPEVLPEIIDSYVRECRKAEGNTVRVLNLNQTINILLSLADKDSVTNEV
jgi:hypothetical protein